MLTCWGETNNTGANVPFTNTLVPANDVGSGSEAAAIDWSASEFPNTETNDPGAIGWLYEPAVTTDDAEISGVWAFVLEVHTKRNTLPSRILVVNIEYFLAPVWKPHGRRSAQLTTSIDSQNDLSQPLSRSDSLQRSRAGCHQFTSHPSDP